MTGKIEEYLAECAGRSAAVSSCVSSGGISLGEYAGVLADKARRNSRISPLRDPGDFYRYTAEYAEKRLGRDAARGIFDAVSCGVMNTSDHHGALFCSQTFQGDLLFGELLSKLGYKGGYIPIHSGGQVELGNDTYARGFCSYASADEIKLIPLFPYKDKNRLSSYTAAVSPELRASLMSRMDGSGETEAVKTSVKELCEALWGESTVPESGRFADQTVNAGVELSKRIFSSEDGPTLTYIELEEITVPLLTEEIRDSGSLISQLLFDTGSREAMQSIKTPDGAPLSVQLFRSVDDKGRRCLLTLTPEGTLTGLDWHGRELKYTADAEELCRLMKERVIYPGFFLISLALAFERGITWMGGVFQSQYLPSWQRCVAELLETCGMRSESNIVSSIECDGYVCGPMFAQYEGAGFAACAGPLEFHMIRPSFGHVREQMLATDIADAHLIGLAEIYACLVPPAEREEGWYGTISRALYRRFPSNVLREQTLR